MARYAVRSSHVVRNGCDGIIGEKSIILPMRYQTVEGAFAACCLLDLKYNDDELRHSIWDCVAKKEVVIQRPRLTTFQYDGTDSWRHTVFTPSQTWKDSGEVGCAHCGQLEKDHLISGHCWSEGQTMAASLPDDLPF